MAKTKKLTRNDYKSNLVTDSKNKKLRKIWKDNYHFFNVIGDKNLSNKQRKCIIKTMQPKQVMGMGKIVNDLLYSQRNIKFPTEKLKELKKHIRVVKKLASKKGPVKTRKKYMIQKGGIFPFLIPLAMKLAGPILGAVASSVATKVLK